MTDQDDRIERDEELTRLLALGELPEGFDWEAVAKTLSDRLVERVGRLARGRADDIRDFAAQMAVDLTMAAATADERALRHLAAQSRMLAEASIIGASREAWGALQESVLDMGLTLTGAVAASGSMSGGEVMP